MIQTMMALGSYRFGLSTAAYDSLRRSASWRWPAQERLGALPVRQFVGPGEQSITIDGKILPHYKGLLGLPNLLARVPALTGGIGAIATINSALGRVGLGIPGRSGTVYTGNNNVHCSLGDTASSPDSDLNGNAFATMAAWFSYTQGTLSQDANSVVTADQQLAGDITDRDYSLVSGSSADTLGLAPQLTQLTFDYSTEIATLP